MTEVTLLIQFQAIGVVRNGIAQADRDTRWKEIETGIFATPTPQRPNPIGVCAVPLLDVRDNVLRVRGLDALDGTPVLDIKPYHSRGDAIENAIVGEWVKKYWQDHPELKR